MTLPADTEDTVIDISDPPRSSRHLIVGIGASAGGLAAYQAFFKAMPPDSGMAYVLVQHLDPNYESALAEIIGDCTAMRVTSAVDGVVVAPNTVSVIPPNAILKIENGILRVAKPETPTARRSSIDIFLMSLAQDQGENAVGIILAGYGSDGTIGISAIKEAGGLTLSEAAFDHHAKIGMPQSAAAGGFVDNILSVEAMPKALLDYRDYKANVGAQVDPGALAADLAGGLVKICAILHSRLGQDFGQYKTSTMVRRIRRRMQVLRIGDLDEYAEQLRTLPDEPKLLFQEILIGVTRFFRDPVAFDTLAATIIPALIANGDRDTPIRLWVAGCATGEEAYSLAILLKEACLRADCARVVTIFATDVDDRSITFARAALFNNIIEADISEERLAHHFVKEGARYRVAKHIRDMCVFSTHDLVKDPPFSKLDMISCRNLLIYFEIRLQQRVLTIFHYGLKPQGTLWLGPSETISSRAKLFEAVDKRCRIYQRRDGPAEVLRPSRRGRAAKISLTPSPREENRQAARLLAQYTPAYLVLDGQNEIQHFSGSVGRFLEPVAGGASLNLFRLLHSDLRGAARALVKKASQDGARARQQVSFYVDGRRETINLIAEAMTEPGGGRRGLLLVFQELLQVAPPEGALETAGPAGEDAGQIELIAARERLQTITEELETANEELQSSNEEFQSVNEELHSTVEELETSKEELQSINEELQTVNAELNNRADNLKRTNSDLANLFDSTAIATLFLDNELCIRRFTPAISDIFNVRDGDEGRPITDFASRLGDERLAPDARSVLRDLKSIEREVDLEDGTATYLLRIKPYRALNNVIDGVSVTLVDITERKTSYKMRARLAAIVESSEDAIISHDLSGLITSWNAGAQKIYGYKASDIIGQPMSLLLAQDQVDEWPANLAKLRRGEAIANFDISRTTKDGRPIDLSLMISPIRDEDGKIVGASAVARDIAERRASDARATLLMSELDHRVKNILAVVSSVVSQTLHSSRPETLGDEIEGRIMAISRAHNLLAEHGGTDVSMRDLVAREFLPFKRSNNVSATGPDIVLTASASVTFALAFHELATNAVKFGCLSAAGGKLTLSWRVSAGSPPVLHIEWIESGGPKVLAPTRRGFGSRLIDIGLVRGLGASVDRDFAKTGVRCLIAIPLTPAIGAVRAGEPVGDLN